MPTPALNQHYNTPVCHRLTFSLRKLTRDSAPLPRLQAVPERSRKFQQTHAPVLTYGCAESAKRNSIRTGSQHQNEEVLTPHGNLKTSQVAADGRPILSGGGGGIFFFWQLGIPLSLLHALAKLALSCTMFVHGVKH